MNAPVHEHTCAWAYHCNDCMNVHLHERTSSWTYLWMIIPVSVPDKIKATIATLTLFCKFNYSLVIFSNIKLFWSSTSSRWKYYVKFWKIKKEKSGKTWFNFLQVLNKMFLQFIFFPAAHGSELYLLARICILQ